MSKNEFQTRDGRPALLIRSCIAGNILNIWEIEGRLTVRLVDGSYRWDNIPHFHDVVPKRQPERMKNGKGQTNTR